MWKIYPVVIAKVPFPDPFSGYTHWLPPPQQQQQQREYQMPIVTNSLSSSTWGVTGSYSSSSSSSIANRWHPPKDDESPWIPLKSKKKHPKFTVEIIEEEEWK